MSAATNLTESRLDPVHASVDVIVPAGEPWIGRVDQGQVLQQAGQAGRRVRQPQPQPGRVQSAGLPRELGPRSLQREDQHLGLAARIAVDGMLDLMEREHGLSRPDALGLASVVVDLRVTQVVNQVLGVHAVLRDDAFL